MISSQVKIPGSFSIGELYNDDERLGDARLCGTTASLCGIEYYDKQKDKDGIERAIQLDLTLHAFMLSQSGIPVIYSGDEVVQYNDYSYKKIKMQINVLILVMYIVEHLIGEKLVDVKLKMLFKLSISELEQNGKKFAVSTMYLNQMLICILYQLGEKSLWQLFAKMKMKNSSVYIILVNTNKWLGLMKQMVYIQIY